MLCFNSGAFLVEVGMYGNPVGWSYEKRNALTTLGMWFQNMWEVAFHLKSCVKIHKQFQIGLVREGDSALMRLFLKPASERSTCWIH